MPGNFTLRRTYVDGDILSAADYVADLQQFITNLEPVYIDDASSSVDAMRTTTDTGDVGTESLATTLAGEIARLRYAIKDIKQKLYNGGTVSQWYTKSYSNVPADGSITTAKLANAATRVQDVAAEGSGAITGVESTLVSQAITTTRTNVRVTAFLHCKWSQTGLVTATSDITMKVYLGALAIGEAHAFVGDQIGTVILVLPAQISWAGIVTPGVGTFTFSIKASSTNLTNVTLTGSARLQLEEIA